MGYQLKYPLPCKLVSVVVFVTITESKLRQTWRRTLPKNDIYKQICSHSTALNG